MKTYLYLHKENTGIPQAQFRGRYPLRHMDYELGRTVGRKGEATSGIRGGEIRVAIEGLPIRCFCGGFSTPRAKRTARSSP